MLRENTSIASTEIIRGEKWGTSRKTEKKVAEIQTLRLFSGNRLLAAQNREVCSELFPLLEPVYFSGSEFLHQPGRRVDYVYFPVTAIVSEYRILEDGRTIEVAMIGNEGVIGLLPIFDNFRAVNWTQIAISGSAVRVESRAFEQKLLRHPCLQKLLFEYANAYVEQISHRAACSNSHSIEQRLCSWLLMMQKRRRSADFLALTQEQIARALGVHRPSITNIAQNLREKKLIDYARGKIQLLDRRKLEETACPCYAEIDRHLN